MKRLLCIVGSLNQGGAETFLMKLLRNFDRTEYMLDFCVMSDETGIYETEITTLGGKIFHIVPKSRNPIKCFFEIKRIVQENDYKSVIRVNEHSLSVLDLIAAKLGGAEKLIMRSSNTDSGSKKQRILHKLFSFLPRFVPNVKIAPSRKAAEYTFGKKNVKKGKVNFLQNGLAVEDFSFDKEIRNSLRTELGIEDKFVVGHIGRFQKQKNHKFLIGVFKEILVRKGNAQLVLVGGNGELLEEVKECVKAQGLVDKVLFLGNRSDVNKLLSAFDILVFPSLYEGMPNVVIEAQAAGLPCLISDTITPEADITGLVKYYPLEKSAKEWATEAIQQSKRFERRSYNREFCDAGYTIDAVTEKFIELVF